MNTPAEIAKNYLAVGKAKAQLPLGKMFLLAVLAGAFKYKVKGRWARAGCGPLACLTTFQLGSLYAFCRTRPG